MKNCTKQYIHERESQIIQNERLQEIEEKIN